jgi:hypothetical protein
MLHYHLRGPNLPYPASRLIVLFLHIMSPPGLLLLLWDHPFSQCLGPKLCNGHFGLAD